MYRPTVRYDDSYKNFVNDLFHATTLDRNQLIRAALFIAAHSEDYKALIRPYLRRDVPLPSPIWRATDHGLWLEQSPVNREEGRDVNDSQKEIRREAAPAQTRRFEQTPRRAGEVRQERQSNGGLKIFIK